VRERTAALEWRCHPSSWSVHKNHPSRRPSALVLTAHCPALRATSLSAHTHTHTNTILSTLGVLATKLWEASEDYEHLISHRKIHSVLTY